MRIGPHIIQLTPAGLDWARRATIVKSLDNLEPLRVARPDALRVFRHYFPTQPFDNPAGAAATILAVLGGYHHRNLWVELYNETAQRLGEGLQQHTAWTYDVTCRLHEAGYNVAGFSFSTGQPRREDWRYLRDQDFAGVDALSSRAYWGNQGFTAEHALRHRQVHTWLNGEHPPFIIGECGRDRVEGGLGGWQRDGIGQVAYVGELAAYGREIERDCYVLGATPFTAGPTPDWAAFDTDGLDVQPLLVEVPVTAEEFERWAADVWHRAGVPFNKDAGLTRFWLDSAKRGHYLGRPEGPEHRTENGQWVYEEFSGCVLHCRVGEWIVSEGLPPFA